MKHFRMSVQSRVDETQGRLPSSNPLLVDPSEDCRESRRARRRAADEDRNTPVEYHDVVADRREVWVATPGTIVDTTVSIAAAAVVSA